LHAIHIVRVLREVLSDNAVLAIDGGSIGQWAHQLLCDRYPGHWLTCGRSGVVGWGLGGAMGARLVFPEQPVVLLSGDGAFTFAPAEIECAVRQRLPFVAIVADDQAWGITRVGHEAKFGEAISSTLGAVDFARMAEAFFLEVCGSGSRHYCGGLLGYRQVGVFGGLDEIGRWRLLAGCGALGPYVAMNRNAANLEVHATGGWPGLCG
jgi:TPP-dependent trihydroxycyclohexane-1,2-dione (THcHDO) dehydratase